jgi:hypothetical protein
MAKAPKSKTPGMKMLTKRERSSLAKQARAGADIGKAGKEFESIAEQAAKRYGSKERGRAVAAAAMIRARASRLGK